jgi:hypothetical protein
MIEFKDVEVSDKETILKYTLESLSKNCDLSFSNMCSWYFYYQTKFAIVEDFLLLKYLNEGEWTYMLPVGNGDLKHMIEVLMDDARQNDVPFCMGGICEDMKTKLEELMPDSFTYTFDRDLSDYVYLRTDLSTLVGKKFQSKRIHLNKFRHEYNYRYIPITSAHIKECLDLEKEWCIVNNCEEQEGTGNERQAVIYALKNFDDLGLSGGLLYVENKIVAFTLGMPINKTTFGVHVEKADVNYEGAYAMINYEFANQIPEQYVYMNREEDLGIEGLRRAKLSYQPTIILDKYTARIKKGDL